MADPFFKGGKLTDGRMIARKDDPIWTAISAFGRPYPPFDYNSGMITREIFRGEAERLKVIKRSDIIKAQNRTLNADAKLTIPDKISPDLRAEVLAAFGDTIITAGTAAQLVKGLAAAELAAAQAAQAEAGREIMQQVIDNQEDAFNAMKRADIDSPIDFRYGDSSMGIAHIIEKHGTETALNVPDVIAFGEIEPKGEHKINITLGDDLVVVTDDLDGERVNRWVLTAFEKKGGAR